MSGFVPHIITCILPLFYLLPPPWPGCDSPRCLFLPQSSSPTSLTGRSKLLPCMIRFYILTYVFARVLPFSLMVEGVNISETSVEFYQPTWCNIPEDNHVHTRILVTIETWNLTTEKKVFSSSSPPPDRSTVGVVSRCLASSPGKPHSDAMQGFKRLLWRGVRINCGAKHAMRRGIITRLQTSLATVNAGS